MNLIGSRWINFVDDKGNRVKGTPSAIAFPHIVDVECNREELRAGMYQFLIALLHTAFQPRDQKEWGSRYISPPSPIDLHRAFQPFEDTFQFSGEGSGPRFMQEYGGLNSPSPIRSVIIGAPGESTSKKNLDLFTKAGQITGMCEGCVASAIYTFSCAGISNGGGHREGLRKPNHMTSLIMPKGGQSSLWQKLWLNVLTAEEFPVGRVGSVGRTLFPWLAPTITSEGKQVVTKDAMHPLHVFWPMASRFYLDDQRENGHCDVCGDETDALIRTIHRVRHGMNYEGQWKHPLTPYSVNKTSKGVHLPVYPPIGEFNYGNWRKVVTTGKDVRDAGTAAMVVESYSRKADYCKKNGIELPETPVLWLTGFCVDSAKIVSWTSVSEPYFNASPSTRERLMVMMNDLYSVVDTAWTEVGKSMDVYEWNRGSNKVKRAQIRSRIHALTEKPFFAQLPVIARFAELGSTTMSPETAKNWHTTVMSAALQVFDDLNLAAPDKAVLLKVIEKRKKLKATLHAKTEGFRELFEDKVA